MIPAHRSNYVSKYGMVILFMKILIAALLIQKKNTFLKTTKYPIIGKWLNKFREMVK